MLQPPCSLVLGFSDVFCTGSQRIPGRTEPPLPTMAGFLSPSFLPSSLPLFLNLSLPFFPSFPHSLPLPLSFWHFFLLSHLSTSLLVPPGITSHINSQVFVLRSASGESKLRQAPRKANSQDIFTKGRSYPIICSSVLFGMFCGLKLCNYLVNKLYI